MPNSIELIDIVWRFSGFDPNGVVIEFEFAGPTSSTETTPFREIAIVGRDQFRCNYIILNHSVSRIHAELKYIYGQGLAITDLGSSNGTFLNDEQIADDYYLLSTGDSVRFGEIDMTVSIRT